MVKTQTLACSGNLQKTIDKIFSSNQISRTDQQVFMTSLLSKSSLSSEDENLINQVFDKLRRGLIQVID